MRTLQRLVSFTTIAIILAPGLCISQSSYSVPKYGSITLEAEQLILQKREPEPTYKEPPAQLVECLNKGYRVILTGEDASVIGCVASCPKEYKSVRDCRTFGGQGYEFDCVNACWPREKLQESKKNDEVSFPSLMNQLR